jgi:lysophospholipase L1-like esterase
MKTCFQFLVPTVLVVFIFVLDATARLIVYPVGDSITWGTTAAGGYRSPLYQKLTAAGYDVDMVGSKKDFADSVLIAAGERHHDGHIGGKIFQIDQQIEGWLQLFEVPDVILIHIGTNDFGDGAPNSSAIQELDNLMTKIALATPTSHMIVTNLLERGGSANLNIEAQFNPFVEEKIAGQVALGRKVSFLDIRAVVPLSDMPDLLHPNLAGLTKMADAFFDAILKVISPFEITTFDVQDNEGLKQVSITWTSKENRNYVVQISPDASAWSDFPLSIPSGGATTFQTFTIPEESRFFRIREGMPVEDFLLETNVKWLVPSDETLQDNWSDVVLPEGSGFIDGDGLGVGFETRPGPFDPFIQTNVLEAMLSTNPSIYLRYLFDAHANRQYKTLTFGMRYDDGYVAYLNGIEIACRNAPAIVEWDTDATRSHLDVEAVEFEMIDLSDFLELLLPGENILAIQGMNNSIGGADFLMEPMLTSEFE